MTTILAIDPGPEKSGWVIYRNGEMSFSGICSNGDMLAAILISDFDKIAIEMIASYGMSVGKSVFETCLWIGRFYQVALDEHDKAPMLVYRQDVKLHLCNSVRARDANIRQALIDRFPATGGGKIPQIGTKAQPGPLYGISSHAWAALGVAVTAIHQLKQKQTEEI